MILGGIFRQFLDRIGDPDRRCPTYCAQTGERPIVEARTITETMTATIESDKRHENKIGLNLRRIRGWFFDPEFDLNQRLSGPPAAKDERMIAPDHDRQSRHDIEHRKLLEQGHRRGFALDGPIGHGDPGRFLGRERATDFGNTLGESARCSVCDHAAPRKDLRTQQSFRSG